MKHKWKVHDSWENPHGDVRTEWICDHCKKFIQTQKGESTPETVCNDGKPPPVLADLKRLEIEAAAQRLIDAIKMYRITGYEWGPEADHLESLLPARKKDRK